MMKRKFLAVVLPIVGCATVVGSGFGAWYFGETTGASDSDSFGVNIGITNEANADEGALTISSNVTSSDGYYLILDQGGAKNKTNSDSGIMLFQNTGEKLTLPDEVTTTSDKTWNFDINYSGSEKIDKTKTTIKELYTAGLQIRFEISISYSQTLYKYLHVKRDSAAIVMKLAQDTTVGDGDNGGVNLNFGEPVLADSTSTVTYTANYKVIGKDLAVAEAKYNFTLDMNTKGENFVNALFKYNKKPKSSEELIDMKDAIASETITFSVKALIENATSN